MGLDIYVGSLSRYYARDWELIAQKAARAAGYDFQVVYQNNPENISQEEARPIIISWRDSIREGIKGSLKDNEKLEFNWDETPESQYFTDKPDWDGYCSLLLWAAYSEHDDLVPPEKCVKDLNTDEALNRSTEATFKTTYPALLRDVQLWIPEEFIFCFGTQDATGQETMIESVMKLEQELLELNDKTWKADAQIITEWRDNGPSDTGNLEDAAKFGFSVFLDMANKAVENNLVMKLDY